MEIEESVSGVACVAVRVPAPGAPAAVSAALPLEEFHRRERQVTEALRQVAAAAAKFHDAPDISRPTGG